MPSFIQAERLKIPHVRRRFNGWNELENGVGDADEPDYAARNPIPPRIAHNDGSDEDIDCCRMLTGFDYRGCWNKHTDTSSDEREHKGRVFGHDWRYLKFCGAVNWD